MVQTAAPMPPAGRKMTYEEFLETDFEFAVEWVDGEIVPLTVTVEHNDLGHLLLLMIKEYVTQKQLGRVFSEPFQMKTGPGLPGRSPDLFFLAAENLARLKKHHIAGPADLVIEILSSESERRDQTEKYEEYRQGGVREYWILDPERKQADFYLRDAAGQFQQVSPDGEGIYRSAVLEGFWLRVDWFWQTPQPTLLSVLKAWGMV